MEYSPFVLDIESTAGTDMLSTCRELGVSVICYSPLGRGLLTDAFTSKDSVTSLEDPRSSRYPRFAPENLDANIEIAAHFKGLADKKGCTSSQLALAWLVKQGDEIIPIPGTKSIKRLRENWSALGVALSDDEEAEIRAYLESVEVKGCRSMPQVMASAYTDTVEES